jgi:pyruvate ferredoxin oxidoreductase gamma subunit
MSEIYGIRIHGRAGQGAKSAGEIIAESAMEEGKEIQAFPEFGAEKLGAPVRAFVKISDNPISSNEQVIHPDCVIVVDPYFIEQFDVVKGLKKEGILVVNTKKDKEYVKEKTCFGGDIFIVDASRIATEVLGMNKPNISTIGAFIKATGKIKIDTVKKKIEKVFLRKLGQKMVDQNIECLDRGYDEAK